MFFVGQILKYKTSRKDKVQSLNFFMFCYLRIPSFISILIYELRFCSKKSSLMSKTMFQVSSLVFRSPLRLAVSVLESLLLPALYLPLLVCVSYKNIVLFDKLRVLFRLEQNQSTRVSFGKLNCHCHFVNNKNINENHFQKYVILIIC